MDTKSIVALMVAAAAAVSNWMIPVSKFGSISKTCTVCDSGLGILGQAMSPEVMEKCSQVGTLNWLLIVVMVGSLGYFAYSQWGGRVDGV